MDFKGARFPFSFPSLSFVSNEWSGEVIFEAFGRGRRREENKPWIIPALSFFRSFIHSFLSVLHDMSGRWIRSGMTIFVGWFLWVGWLVGYGPF